MLLLRGCSFITQETLRSQLWTLTLSQMFLLTDSDWWNTVGVWAMTWKILWFTLTRNVWVQNQLWFQSETLLRSLLKLWRRWKWDYCGLRRNVWKIRDCESPFALHEISLLLRSNNWCMWDEVILWGEISEKQVVLISSLTLPSIKSHCCWGATTSETLKRSHLWFFFPLHTHILSWGVCSRRVLFCLHQCVL